MDLLPKPFITKVPYGPDFYEDLNSEYARSSVEEKLTWITHHLHYPTVYIVKSRRDVTYGSRYSVYVGETNDIRKRTLQHLRQDPKKRADWQKFLDDKTSEMYVIGHPYFNKSLTLDLENKFLHYLGACKSVEHQNNRRTNEQREYYTFEYLDSLFEEIWTDLRVREQELFDDLDDIEHSAIFKASPFHKLNAEQLEAQNRIFEAVNDAVDESATSSTDQHKLILVSGEAGSGKTVLVSSVFNGLKAGVTDEDERFRNLRAEVDGEGTGIDAYLISGHKNKGGQLTVYEEIVKKLNIPEPKRGTKLVYKPTEFKNTMSEDDPVDVVLIDEAHLLTTQKNQSYTEDIPLLEAILRRAKVVVAIYDPKQTLETPQMWETPIAEKLSDNIVANIQLTSQLRLDADESTIGWIRTLIDDGMIGPIHEDSKGYDLKIFESPQDVYAAIRDKDSVLENSLSRMVATFDWEYSQQRTNDDEPDGRWYVDVYHPSKPLHLAWNLETSRGVNKQDRIAYRRAWSEDPRTINEVGSTYTVQGFDLNYAGVILGPSITFREGRIVIDPSKSAHKKAVQKRTKEDGTKESYGEELIKNELNVLLTRGVKGLYLYAVDEALQQELLRMQSH